MSNAKAVENETQTREQPTGSPGRKSSAKSLKLSAGPTGPRTIAGKERSKFNAVKHGIFTKALLLNRESPREYQALVDDLFASLKPVGRLEDVLVEKLAANLWRYRRLLGAEAAEIRRKVEFLEWDEHEEQQQEAERFQVDLDEYANGLIPKIRNPQILELCIESLTELREQIEARGFDPDQDRPIFKKLYGDREDGRLRENLLGTYNAWWSTATAPELERINSGYASPAQCKQNILEEIDEEIRRLKIYQKARNKVELERRKLERLRRIVPDSSVVERLLRYEAALERAFDRTLTQLERLQRMRLGQPILPPVRVEVSE